MAPGDVFQGSEGPTTSVPRADDLAGAASTRGGGGFAPLPVFHRDELVAGRFKIVRLIGQGGMGSVYEAEDQELGGRVALKTVHRETTTDPRTVERFKQEIYLARKVTHPNVCRIFDLFRLGIRD
jgi:serine/threonine protein kinase